MIPKVRNMRADLSIVVHSHDDCGIFVKLRTLEHRPSAPGAAVGETKKAHGLFPESGQAGAPSTDEAGTSPGKENRPYGPESKKGTRDLNADLDRAFD